MTPSSPDSAKGRLLQEASRLFKAQGYDRTTVRQLSDALGIQSGSLFHHYPSKQAILYGVMDETISLLQARIEQGLAKHSSPFAQLRSLIEAELTSLLTDSREALTVLIFEWQHLSSEQQQSLLKRRNAYEAIWISVIEDCQQQAPSMNPMPAKYLRRLLLGSISWTPNWYKSEQGELSISDLSEKIYSLCNAP